MTIDTVGPGWDRIGHYNPFVSPAALCAVMGVVVLGFVLGMAVNGGLTTSERAKWRNPVPWVGMIVGSLVLAPALMWALGNLAGMAPVRTDSETPPSSVWGYRYAPIENAVLSEDNEVYQQRMANALRDIYGLKKITEGKYANLDGSHERACDVIWMNGKDDLSTFRLSCNGVEPPHITKPKTPIKQPAQ